MTVKAEAGIKRQSRVVCRIDLKNRLFCPLPRRPTQQRFDDKRSETLLAEGGLRADRFKDSDAPIDRDHAEARDLAVYAGGDESRRDSQILQKRQHSGLVARREPMTVGQTFNNVDASLRDRRKAIDVPPKCMRSANCTKACCSENAISLDAHFRQSDDRA